MKRHENFCCLYCDGLYHGGMEWQEDYELRALAYYAADLDVPMMFLHDAAGQG